MKQSLVVALFMLLACTTCEAQDNVRAGPEVYRAEGIAADLEQARASALNGLMQQIQVFISSTFENVTAERNAMLDQHTSSKTLARSIMSLSDVREDIVKLSDGSFRVTKYVTKEAVSKMFALRREQALAHIKIAQDEILRRPVDIGSSLKHAYWAQLISRLSPDEYPFSLRLDSMSSSAREYKSVLTGVPNLIEGIVKGIVFEPVKKIDDDAIVWKYKVSWNGLPLMRLRYGYFDGMGQAEGEAVNGETKMTFFFSKKEDRTREILIDIEYKYADEMDETLRLADSLKGNVSIPTMVTIILPGSSDVVAPAPPVPVKDTVKIHLPPVLQELLQTKGSFDQTIEKINRLVRQNKIIAGSATTFESLEGLYGVVLSKTGIVLVLRCIKGETVELLTGKKADLKAYAGNRLIWMELLK